MPAASPRRKRRAYHHGDLRAALITAATELVHERGAAAFSLREAARVVGVDAAACYRHFRDRQEVLVAIAQLGFMRLAASFAIDRAKRASAGPRATLLAFAHTYLEHALRRPAEFRVMFGDSGWSARDPRLRLPEVMTTAYEHLEQVAGDYLAASPLAVDAPTLANMLWAVAHGVSRLMIDGALPITEDDARGLLERGVEVTLGARATE